jgi:thioredoxin-dependent peroxiredoxin
MNIFSFFARAEPLVVGASAPQITAPDQDRNPMIFGDVYAKGITLVYFYPKAATPGCTKEACSLRDSYAVLAGKGIQILGVSRDKPESQKAFRDAQHLPFPLIADTDGKVAEAFHVPMIPVAGIPMRQSFLIKDGKIAWLSLKAETSGAAQEVSKALETLK